MLDASVKEQAAVRYLPEGARIGSSSAEDLTIVTTYVQKKAKRSSQSNKSAGSKWEPIQRFWLSPSLFNTSYVGVPD